MTDATLMTENPTDNGDSATASAEDSTPEAQTAPSTEDNADTTQQADDSQGQAAADDGAPTGESEADTTDEPTGAPETYEFTPVDGQEFDPEAIKAFEGVARENDLSQEAAQSILDTMGEVMQARRQAVVDDWLEQARSDKELGGDKLDQTLATAQKALDSLGSESLRTLLNDTGLGNHPEMIRFFHSVGSKLSEDTFVGGGNPGSNQPKSLAQRMYPGS